MTFLPEGVRHETLLLEGRAAPEIIRFAQRRGVSYIVIGMHSRGRIGQLILGSVASKVARGSHCPVVTVANAPVPASEAPDGEMRLNCGHDVDAVKL